MELTFLHGADHQTKFTVCALVNYETELRIHEVEGLHFLMLPWKPPLLQSNCVLSLLLFSFLFGLLVL